MTSALEGVRGQREYIIKNAKKMSNISIYTERTNVMQLGSMFISNCNITLHVSDAFCVHPQEHLKTVVAASGV